MKKKEIKNLAKKIAKNELILQTSDNPKEKDRAQAEIITLSSHVHSIEDSILLDEMVQDFLDNV